MFQSENYLQNITVKGTLLTQSLHIGDNFTGILIKDSHLSEMDFRPEIKPIINPVTIPKIESDTTPIKESLWTKSKKELWAIIIGVAIVVIGGFILFKLGWI